MADSNINIELRVIGDGAEVPTVGRKLAGVKPGTVLDGTAPAAAGAVAARSVGSPVPGTVPVKSNVVPVAAPRPPVPKPALLVPASDAGGVASPAPLPPRPRVSPIPPLVPPPRPAPAPPPPPAPKPPKQGFLEEASIRSVAQPSSWAERIKAFPAMTMGLIRRTGKAAGVNFNIRETGNSAATGMLAVRSLQRFGTGLPRGGVYGAAVVYGGRALQSVSNDVYDAELEGNGYLAARGIAVGRGLVRVAQFAAGAGIMLAEGVMTAGTGLVGTLFDAKGASDANKALSAIFNLARAHVSGSKEDVAIAEDDYRAATGKFVFDEGEARMRSRLVVDDAGNVTYSDPQLIHARYKAQVEEVLRRRSEEVKKALTAHRVQVAMESFHYWGSWTPRNPVTAQFTETGGRVNRQYERVFIQHYENQLTAQTNRDFDFANERSD